MQQQPGLLPGGPSDKGRSSPRPGQPGQGAPADTDGYFQCRGGRVGATPAPAPLLYHGVPWVPRAPGIISSAHNLILAFFPA